MQIQLNILSFKSDSHLSKKKCRKNGLIRKIRLIYDVTVWLTKN